MVSALDSGLSGPGLSPGQGHCVVFLGKTLDSRSASLHPGVQISTHKFNAGVNPAMYMYYTSYLGESRNTPSCSWPDGAICMQTYNEYSNI